MAASPCDRRAALTTTPALRTVRIRSAVALQFRFDSSCHSFTAPCQRSERPEIRVVPRRIQPDRSVIAMWVAQRPRSVSTRFREESRQRCSGLRGRGVTTANAGSVLIPPRFRGTLSATGIVAHAGQMPKCPAATTQPAKRSGVSHHYRHVPGDSRERSERVPTFGSFNPNDRGARIASVDQLSAISDLFNRIWRQTTESLDACQSDRGNNAQIPTA